MGKDEMLREGKGGGGVSLWSLPNAKAPFEVWEESSVAFDPSSPWSEILRLSCKRLSEESLNASPNSERTKQRLALSLPKLLQGRRGASSSVLDLKEPGELQWSSLPCECSLRVHGDHPSDTNAAMFIGCFFGQREDPLGMHQTQSKINACFSSLRCTLQAPLPSVFLHLDSSNETHLSPSLLTCVQANSKWLLADQAGSAGTTRTPLPPYPRMTARPGRLWMLRNCSGKRRSRPTLMRWGCCTPQGFDRRALGRGGREISDRVVRASFQPIHLSSL